MNEIKPIQEHQIEQVKQIITTVCLEIWQGVLSEDDLRCYDSMSEIGNVRSRYFNNCGTFLVLVDDEQVVGSGANGLLCERLVYAGESVHWTGLPHRARLCPY